MSVYLSVGADKYTDKYAVLKFIVQLAAVLLNFFSLLGYSRFYESARSSRVHTYKFIYFVVAEIYFLCRYFCRLGPALKYVVLKFLVRLVAVYSLGCGRE